MKTLFLFLCLVSLAVATANAQDNDMRSKEILQQDTLSFLKERFENRKSDFVGKPAKVVFEEYQRYLPVNYAAQNATSAYIDPEGHFYLEGVSIYWDVLDVLKRKHKLVKLCVTFEDTHQNFTEHVRRLPDDARNAQLLTYLENFIVKDLQVIVVQMK